MSENENFYRFEDVTIDCENFRVQKDGRNVNLTPRAFDVLLFLVKNVGRVVEKREFFDEVWKDTFVTDGALTKIIKEIRHELGDDSAHPRFIETVPKRGFRFVAQIQKSERTGAVSLPDENSVVEKSPQTINRLDPGSPASQRKFQIVGLICLSVLAATSGFFLFYRSPSEPIAEAPIDSIAVLPFENVMRDESLEYASDGIAENVINNLSQLSNLKVISRSSVFRYKGPEQNAQKIGDELNVRAVLTGNIQKIGDRIVINVRLEDVRNDRNLWGTQYIREFTDLLAVQNEIAQEVSRNLRLRLTTVDEQKLTKRYTDNVEAYQLYLKGNHEWNKFTPEGLLKSIEYYNQSIEKDSNYALAYAGLAAAYSVLGNNFTPPHETYPKARIYALK